MKKITSLLTICAMSSLVFGQSSTIKKPALISKKNITVTDRNVSVNSVDNENVSTRAVIWSDDFSVPANWTMSNTSTPAQNWEIITTGAWPTNLSSQGFPVFVSPSGGNFALINSDLAGASAVQRADITTANSINLSANPAVVLEFYNYTKVFFDSLIVQVSNNGTTWVSYPVNTQYGYTYGGSNYVTTPNPEKVTVNITPTAGGQATVWIRFRYKGAYDWFWAIDDVSISDLAPNDIVLGAVFYGEYSRIPVGQQMPITLGAGIANIGAAAQTNVVLNVAVNNTVFTGSSAVLASMAVGETDTVAITTQFTPGGIGDYAFAFAAIQTETDANPANNATSDDTIKVTANTYARDSYQYTGNGVWNGAGEPFELGNLYSIATNTIAISINFVLQGSTSLGSIVAVKLYDATLVNVIASSNPYTILSADIPSSSGINPISVTLPFTSPAVLEADSSYVAVVEFLNLSGTDTVVLATGSNIAQQSQTSFLYDTPTATWLTISSTPMVRLCFDFSVGINEANSANGITLFQNQPNPFSNISVITYELEKSASVALSVYDVTGKKVAEQNEGNQSKGQHTINVDAGNLSAGVYYYSLTVGKHVTSTMKMVVIK